jgi:uncharacterized membrane protein
MKKRKKAKPVASTVELLQAKKEQIQSFKAKMNHRRSLSDRLADKVTSAFGSVWFFVGNVLWLGLWILINMDLIPGLPVFDPFPFGLLTMIMSLEAIFLSIFVLISQNRAAFVADLREEIDLKVNVRAEQEITRLINMVDEIHDHLGLAPDDDDELREMKKRVNLEEMEEEISKEMNDND